MISYLEDPEHGLRHIECVSPVVIRHIAIILLYTEQPAPEYLKYTISHLQIIINSYIL